MNKKVLTRIVAAILAVMMLGTVAFAVTPVKPDANGNIVTPDLDDAYKGQEVYTVMAYKAATANAEPAADGSDIIAIEQSDDISKIETIKINTASVKTPYIKIVYGGDGGATKEATIDMSATENFDTISISVLTAANEGQGWGTYAFGEGENAKSFSNVVKVVCSIAGEGKVITKVGVKFDGKVAEDVYAADGETLLLAKDEVIEEEISKSISHDGQGNVSFTAFLFGVPEADVDALTATPFIEYY